MANINQATIDAAQKKFNAEWTSAFTAAPQKELLVLATQYTSDQASNNYLLMQSIDCYRKWNGARVFKDISSNLQEVVNDDYENSIKIPINAIKDDKVGLYLNIVPGMVEGWEKLKQELIMDVLVENPNAYDGDPLFSSTRTYGDSEIDNTTLSGLTADTFEAARIAMMSYTDHAGKPLAVTPNVLVVGPTNEKNAFNIVSNHFGLDNSSTIQVENFFKKTGMVVITSPYLVGANANKWYMADTTKIVKGVLLQIRENPILTLSDSQEVARYKTMDYMADGRLAAAPGAPHLIYGGLTPAS